MNAYTLCVFSAVCFSSKIRKRKRENEARQKKLDFIHLDDSFKHTPESLVSFMMACGTWQMMWCNRYLALIALSFLFVNLLVESVDGQLESKPWYERLPAVAMDYKVHLDAGKEDCYYQYVQPGATFYVSFQVNLQSSDRSRIYGRQHLTTCRLSRRFRKHKFRVHVFTFLFFDLIIISCSKNIQSLFHR